MKQRLIYGYHAVRSVLDLRPSCVSRVILQKGRLDQRVEAIQDTARAAGLDIECLSKRDMDALVEGPHQGFMVVCHEWPSYEEADLWALCEASDAPLFLVLDGVTDPHNLGACLRTADAMGVSAVVVPKDRAVGLTPVVQKVACGAAFTLPFIPVVNLARVLKGLQKRRVWLVGLDAGADNKIADIDLTGAVALVLGSEGEGLRRLTKETCDYLAKIPMWGSVESLNVSVSTGMVLYEVSRQRHVDG